ncbi:EMB2076 [Symbiodinium natans]|uniref:EMB2076 protein n=1 Tax=Symbiodinium natans TaxID=878477 RepID=A0A812J8N0_9DINO|nr:EMB2076 [Symbiodinium natans]
MRATGHEIKASAAQPWRVAHAAALHQRVQVSHVSLLDVNKMLAGAARDGQWRLVLLWLQCAQIKLDLVSFNSAITGLGRAARWFQALDLFSRLSPVALRPSAVSRTLVATSTSTEKAGQRWQMSLLLLCDAFEDAVACSTALISCRGRNWRLPLLLLAIASAKTLRPNAVILTATMAKQTWTRSLQQLQACSRLRLRVDSVAFVAAVASCAWRGSLELLASGRRCGLPGSSARSAAVAATSEALLWEESIAVLLSPRRSRRSGEISPQYRKNGLCGFVSAIAACDATRRWAWALELLHRAPVLGLGFDLDVLNAAISACESAWRQAWATLGVAAKGLAAQSPRPDLISWNTLLTCTPWPSALEVFRGLRRRGLLPDVISTTALVTACEEGLRWSTSLTAVSLMREDRLPCNVQTFTVAASVCQRVGRHRLALLVLERMRLEGLAWDVAALSVALLACEWLPASPACWGWCSAGNEVRGLSSLSEQLHRTALQTLDKRRSSSRCFAGFAKGVAEAQAAATPTGGLSERDRELLQQLHERHQAKATAKAARSKSPHKGDRGSLSPKVHSPRVSSPASVEAEHHHATTAAAVSAAVDERESPKSQWPELEPDALQNEVAAREVELRVLRQELETRSQEVLRLEGQIRDAEDQLRQAAGQVGTLSAKAEVASGSKQAVLQASARNIDSQVMTLKKRLASAESELAEKDDELSGLQEAIHHGSQQVAAKAADLQAMQHQHKLHGSKVAKLQKDSDLLHRHMAIDQWRHQVEALVEQEQQDAVMVRERREHQRQIEVFQEEILALQSYLTRMEEKSRYHAEEIQRRKELLKALVMEERLCAAAARLGHETADELKRGQMEEQRILEARLHEEKGRKTSVAAQAKTYEEVEADARQNQEQLAALTACVRQAAHAMQERGPHVSKTAVDDAVDSFTQKMRQQGELVPPIIRLSPGLSSQL